MLSKHNKNIDDYRIKSLIHRDGFNHLFVIQNKESGELFTANISIIKDNPFIPNENKFIYNDLNIVSKIKHPSITKYIGFSPIDFDHNPRPVIITEHCKKGSLRSNIDSACMGLADELWNNTNIHKIIYGIANVMNFLHSHDIIHKNLKPSVFLLDDMFNPKICDFTIAGKYDPEIRELLGTSLYMAPETLEYGEITKKSDVFAFSMIVYELVTLRMPFKDHNPILERLSNIRPPLDDILDNQCYKNLITRCWSQNPDDRPSFEEITQYLKTDIDFIANDIDEIEFKKYVKYIEQSKIEYELDDEIKPISENDINQPITKELKQLFYEDPQKIKYLMILEAKQEMNILLTYNNYNQNSKLKIDLDNLKSIIIQKYFKLIEKDQIDEKIQQNINDIIDSIDEEYNKLVEQIKTKSICASSLDVLNQIIQILTNCYSNTDFANIQEQINQILDKYPKDGLLFNKDKLREISFSSVSETLLSLNSIKNNPKYRNPLLNENPKLSVLYSPAIKNINHTKSLANILSGNCFFITMYGKHCTTRSVLSFLFDEIESHQMDDVITIYGPVNFATFGQTIIYSNELLKYFNGNFPNLYFIEVSSEYEDQTMKEWNEFLSYISHYLIFCSRTIPTEEEVNHFKDSLLLQHFNGSLIICSRSSKTPISFGDMEYEYINIYSLWDSCLHSYLFSEIYLKRFEFIPSDIVTLICETVIGEKNMTILQNDKKSTLPKMIMKDYSFQIHNKAIEYFHIQIQQLINEIYLNIESEKFVDSFKLDESLSYLIYKTQKYLYTNIYVEFWNDEEIKLVSKVLKSEVENEFESSVLPIKNLESIKKLLTLFKNDELDISFNESLISLINNVRNINSKVDPYSENDLSNLYNETVIAIKENQEMNSIVQSFIDNLYKFLEQNPTASDKEYSKYYQKLYNEYKSSKYPTIEKYIDITLNIRKVLDKYRPTKFTVQIDKRSFDSVDIKLKSNMIEFSIAPKTKCEEFFKLIEKSFNLENIPFYIKRLTNNQFDEPIEVIVINDCANLSQLNAYNFTVYYGTRSYSTKVLIESLIVQKTIEIADDFMITSNSKNADYEVNFPTNHKGWFNVEFDIKNKSTEKYENEYTLIYLTMTVEEISFLQEGNLLYHQSYKDGEYIDEVDPIFLSFPGCQTAVFPLRHCSLHKLIQIPIGILRGVKKIVKQSFFGRFLSKIYSFIKSNKTQEEDINVTELLDPNYSRDWEYEDGNIKYIRGGSPYYLPVGFRSVGIKVENWKKNTCVGFHATKATNLFKIIYSGFKLPSKRKEGVRKGHIPLGVKKFEIDNFADAIFVSPSIIYASFYGYNDEGIVASSKISSYVHVGHLVNNKILIIILQTRVTPNSYQIIPNTTEYLVNDPHYDNDHMEWRIPNNEDVYPYRILFKNISINDFWKPFVKVKKNES